MEPWSALTGVIRNILSAQLDESIRLTFCDRDENGGFARFAGLRAVGSASMIEYWRVGHCSPVLMFGLFPLDIDHHARDLGGLERWPGFSYLPYGFDEAELVATAQRVAEGAKEALPTGFASSADSLRPLFRLVSDIRHWLRNRRDITELMKQDLESIASDTQKSLDPSYLKPVEAISPSHRLMLARLYEFDPVARKIGWAGDVLDLLQGKLEAYESTWNEVEKVRAAYASAMSMAAGDADNLLVTRFIASVAAACAELNAAIEATHRLDYTLKSGYEG